MALPILLPFPDPYPPFLPLDCLHTLSSTWPKMRDRQLTVTSR